MSASLSMPLQSLNLPNFTIGTVVQQPKTGTGNNESLQQVLQQLVQALTTKSGGTNTDSPLAKMLQKFLDQSSGSGSSGKSVSSMSPDELMSALSDMIKSKLGNNFGAASNLGGSDSSQGQGDLMSQVLGGLAKSAMDDTLKSQGDGATFADADKGTLKQVATFMDQNPQTFGKPDNADGKTGSWTDELNEDNYLNKDETDKFRGAMDMIGQQLSSGNATGAGALGGGNGLSLGGNTASTGGLGQGVGPQTNPSQGSNSNDLTELKMLLGMMEMQQEIQNLQQQQNGGTQQASNDSSTDDLVDELLMALLSNKAQQHSNHGHAGGHRSPAEGGHGPAVHNPEVGAPTLGGSLGGGDSQSLTSGAQAAAGNVLNTVLG